MVSKSDNGLTAVVDRRERKRGRKGEDWREARKQFVKEGKRSIKPVCAVQGLR